MSEERDEIIVLIDDDGNEVAVEHIDTVFYKGNEYVILRPTDDDGDGDGDGGDDDDEFGGGEGSEGDAGDDGGDGDGGGGGVKGGKAGRGARFGDGHGAGDGIDDGGGEEEAGDMGDEEEDEDEPDCDTCPNAEECWSDLDEEEIVILRVQKNGDGYETYVTIDDESEQDAVFELFMERVEDGELDLGDGDDGDDDGDGGDGDCDGDDGVEG